MYEKFDGANTINIGQEENKITVLETQLQWHPLYKKISHSLIIYYNKISNKKKED